MLFAGERPRFRDMEVASSFNACGMGTKRNETLVTGADGGVANAVVFLDRVYRGKPASALPPARVDQRDCVFRPHVGLALCGAPITLANADTVLHNVHATTVVGWYPLFNVGMPAGAGEQQVSIGVPGPVSLKCDAGHVWMRAYVYAVPNPYAAVTADTGAFAIDGIPPGRHTLRVWHEWLEELAVPVEVAPSGVTRVTIVNDGKKLVLKP